MRIPSPQESARGNLFPDGSWARRFALLSFVATAIPVSAAEAGTQAAEPAAPIHSYIAADDYPAEALTRGEQGTVEFLLTIGVDGKPTDCVVTSSSGSSSLDSASCLIMMERARFRPAKNAAGKLVSGSYQNKIVWRLDNSGPFDGLGAPPAVNTATSLWFACAWGEAAKLATSDLSAATITGRAFAVCTPLEERIAVEMRKASIKGMEPSKLIPILKKDVEERLPEMLNRSRAALKGEVRE